MLPTVPQLRAAEKSFNQRVSYGAMLERPTLPAARRSTQLRLAQRASRQRPPAGAGISAGPPPRRVRRALPTWSCRRTYGALIRSVARSPECLALCKQQQIAAVTWTAVMLSAAYEADTITGMCWASYEAIGAPVNRRHKVVQRAFTVARALGLALEVYRGRELGRDERLQLHRDSGGAGHPQRGIPSGWQLAAVPPTTAARFSTPHPGRFTMWSRFDHLPPWGSFSLTSHVGTHHLCTLTGTTEAASRPGPRQKRVQADPRTRLLAAEMARIVPWLAGESPGRMWPCLNRFATASPAWSAADVLGALRDAATREGRDLAQLDTTTIRTRPAILLAGLLRQLDPVQDYPGPAFAGDQVLTDQLCQVCHTRSGRARDLPITPVVCDSCWSAGEQPTCTIPDCHDGWIHVVDEHSTLLAARPCPGLRWHRQQLAAQAHASSTRSWGVNVDGEEPRF